MALETVINGDMSEQVNPTAGEDSQREPPDDLLRRNPLRREDESAVPDMGSSSREDTIPAEPGYEIHKRHEALNDPDGPVIEVEADEGVTQTEAAKTRRKYKKHLDLTEEEWEAHRARLDEERRQESERRLNPGDPEYPFLRRGAKEHESEPGAYPTGDKLDQYTAVSPDGVFVIDPRGTKILQTVKDMNPDEPRLADLPGDEDDEVARGGDPVGNRPKKSDGPTVCFPSHIMYVPSSMSEALNRAVAEGTIAAEDLLKGTRPRRIGSIVGYRLTQHGPKSDLRFPYDHHKRFIDDHFLPGDDRPDPRIALPIQDSRAFEDPTVTGALVAGLTSATLHDRDGNGIEDPIALAACAERVGTPYKPRVLKRAFDREIRRERLAERIGEGTLSGEELADLYDRHAHAMRQIAGQDFSGKQKRSVRRGDRDIRVFSLTPSLKESGELPLGYSLRLSDEVAPVILDRPDLVKDGFASSPAQLAAEVRSAFEYLYGDLVITGDREWDQFDRLDLQHAVVPVLRAFGQAAAEAKGTIQPLLPPDPKALAHGFGLDEHYGAAKDTVDRLVRDKDPRAKICGAGMAYYNSRLLLASRALRVVIVNNADDLNQIRRESRRFHHRRGRGVRGWRR